MSRERSDFNDLVTILKASTCLVNAQHKLGILHYDCANFATFADAEQVFVIFGIRVQRKSSLANGKYQYIDFEGTTIDSN